MSLPIILIILILIAFILLRVVKNRIFIRNVVSIIYSGDPSNIASLLEDPDAVNVINRRGLWSNILDIFFHKGFFKEFLEACSLSKSNDVRCSVLSVGVKILAIDLETVVEEKALVGEIGFYIVSHRGEGFAYYGVFNDETIKWLNTFIEYFSPKILLGHNISRHDIPILESEGVKIKIPILDTLTLSVVALPEAPGHSLEYLAQQADVKYFAHRPDEDAKASYEIALRLIETLRVKKLLEYVIKTGYKELEGLKEVIDISNVSPLIITFERYDLNSYDLLVAPRTYGSCENEWSPKLIPDLDLDSNNLEDLDLLAAVIIKSARKGGFCDGIKLINRLVVRQDIAEAVKKLCDKICIKPVPYKGVVVESSYFKDLEQVLSEEQFFDNMFIDGIYAVSMITGLSVSEVLDISRRISKTVSIGTAWPEDLKDIEPKEIKILSLDLKPVFSVKSCSNISSRNLNTIFGYIKALNQDSLVLAEAFYSKEACNILKINYTDDPLNIKDRGVFKRLIIPTLWDLRLLARRYRLRPEEMLTGIRELYRNIDIWLIQGAKRLDYKFEEKDLNRENIDLRLSPVAFINRHEAYHNVNEIISKYWGFMPRPYQARSILHMMQPYTKDLSYNKPLTAIILPTGSGKSLIFQSIALSLYEKIGGVTIVISPLLAIIEDHVMSLRRRKINVCRLDGLTSYEKKMRCLEKTLKGEMPLVYMTPEQLQNPYLSKILEEADINYIIFDEAHTVTKWGRSFRPSYLEISEKIRRLREHGFWIPLALFTATLPDSELNLILGELGVETNNISILNLDVHNFDINEILPSKPRVLKGPVLRENIIISGVRAGSEANKLEDLVNMVRKLSEWASSESKGRPWIGIVFTGFVKSKNDWENVEFISKYLSERLGEKIAVFHGQMSRSDKKRILEMIYKTSRGEAREPRIVVATKAFGMGVDIPNIRWIIHYIISESIEDYYQEIGRAGRDGEKAIAALLYNDEDIKRREVLLRRQLLRRRMLVTIWKLIKDVYDLQGGSREILIPAKLFRARLEAYHRKRFDRDFIRNIVGRALQMLSEADVLIYDMYRARAGVCEDGYPIAFRENELVRICLDSYPAKTVSIDPMTLKVSEDGVKIGGVDEYFMIKLYKNVVDWSLVNELIARYAWLDYAKLRAVKKLAELITDGRIEEAKELIRRYLELGLEEREISLALDKLKQFIREEGFSLDDQIDKIFIKTFFVSGGRKEIKRLNAKAIAYAIAYILLRNKIPPDMTIVSVPYGYVSEVKNALEQIENLIGLTLRPAITHHEKLEEKIKKLDPSIAIIAFTPKTQKTIQWPKHLKTYMIKIINIH
jgi:ATP-dependent DNA helicase RecQ